MPTDPYKYFRIEGEELLSALSAGVLSLEKGTASSGIVSDLRRKAHTLKGAARIVKCDDVATAAHELEDLFAAVDETAPRDELVQAMIAQLRAIELGLQALTREPRTLPEHPTQSDSAPLAATEGVVPANPRSLRVDGQELDALITSLVEAESHQFKQRGVMNELSTLHALVDQVARASSLEPEDSPIRRSVQRLSHHVRHLERDLTSAVEGAAQELRDATARARRLRLIPVGSIFTLLERAVQDAARSQAKQAELVLQGGDTMLEGHALEGLTGALLHIVRNAVVHGLELPADRRSRGKQTTGRVTVSVQTAGAVASIECSDDGRGVDIADVRSRYPQQLSGLPDAGVLSWLTKAGVSTASALTPLAGRGIGLDAAREAVERLGGGLSLRVKPGQGLSVLLSFPAVLRIVEGLEVASGDIQALIPLSSIVATQLLRAERLVELDGGRGWGVPHDGMVLPLVTLEQVMGRSIPRRGDRAVVVLESHSGLVALTAQHLGAPRQEVLQHLPVLMRASPTLAGAVVDPGGTVRVVLEPDGIAELRKAGASWLPDGSEPAARVLVVDDSPTTRMLEQSILEANGYTVDLAASAEEGLLLAARASYDLYLVDVEMGEMDGFTFVEQTRSDPQMRRAPAVLVSSRSSRADLERGVRVGASGYIVKHQFDQHEFLSLVASLVDKASRRSAGGS